MFRNKNISAFVVLIFWGGSVFLVSCVTNGSISRAEPTQTQSKFVTAFHEPIPSETPERVTPEPDPSETPERVTPEPDPTITPRKEVTHLPLPWPLEHPSADQVQEAIHCDIDTEAVNRYPPDLKSEQLRENFVPESGCDWAILAAAFLNRSKSDSSAIEEGRIAWANAVANNAAYAFTETLFFGFLESPETVETPPFIEQNLTTITIRYTWSGLGDPVEYEIIISDAESSPTVTGLVNGETFIAQLSVETAQALGKAFTGLLPVDLGSSMIVCFDNYPDWNLTLEYEDKSTVSLDTHESNAIELGGPWWVEIDGKLYMQYSNDILFSMSEIIEELKLPVGQPAAWTCLGWEKPFIDYFFHANAASLTTIGNPTSSPVPSPTSTPLSEYMSNILPGHSDWIQSLVWQSNDILTSASLDGQTIFWNIEGDLTIPSVRMIIGGYGDSRAWSADGRLATGTLDGLVLIWNPKTGQQTHSFTGHSETVTSLAWSTDGMLASASTDDSVIIWDLERGQPAQILKGHHSNVTSLAWSADGRLASGDSNGNVILWDLDRGQIETVLSGHHDNAHAIAWSPDGRLASASTDDSVIVWDLARGQPDQVLPGHKSGASIVAWSPEGQLASGDGSAQIFLWDLEYNDPVIILTGHNDGITSLSWSTEGRLASGSRDGMVILWDPPSP